MFANVQDPVQRQSELATDMGLDTLEMDWVVQGDNEGWPLDTMSVGRRSLLDAGADIGGDTGADTGVPGCDQCADTGTDTGGDTGADTGEDTGSNTCSQDLEIYPWEMQNLDPIAEGESKLQHPVQMS